MDDNNTAQAKDAQNQKAKIRARYQNNNADRIEIIPAAPEENFFEDVSEKRVAIYARVSTDNIQQTSSYELQKSHYTDLIKRHEGWNLVEIYADEGISGTSLKHRDAFNKMMDDCKAGRIDLIVTKSVSRFSRNVVDCIGCVRQLAAMRPPVGVYFEMENIYTLNSFSEMNLSFHSTLAQEESHIKSRLAEDSIEKRFRIGRFLTPVLLGYDHDEDGGLVVNEEEAKTVRLIFFMYLYGYTCGQIAEVLTGLGRMTKKKNTVWSPSSILQILQNERHCGDILARKTYTHSYLDHKSRKNIGKRRNQYRDRNHHEAIISRDDFIAVQRLISNAKYGGKGILPELRVIPAGALKGFVPINPRWAAFGAEEYRRASASAYGDISEPQIMSLEIEAQTGDFDFRGFEITRSQFFNTANKLFVSISADNIQFSSECVHKFGKELYVEMLVHPDEQLFAVRPSTKDSRNAVRWAKIEEKGCTSRAFGGAAYLGTLFELFGWNHDCRYRVCGVQRRKGEEAVIIFDMRETEIFIPSTESDFDYDIQPVVAGPNKSVIAFPPAWADNFGSNYYNHAQARELAAIDKRGMWDVRNEGKNVGEDELNVSSPEIICDSIKKLISGMEQGGRQSDGDLP